MADPTKGPGRKDDQYRPPADFQPTEATKTGKPTGPQRAEEPSISRLKGTPTIEKIHQESPLDPNHPVLSAPSYMLGSSKELETMQVNLEKKFTEPLSYQTIQERINEGAEEVNKLLNNAGQELSQVLSSNRSPEYKTLRIQQILMATMQNLMDISGKYAGFIANKQAESRNEAAEIRMKELEILKKNKTATLIGNIFSCIADFFNILAAFALVITSSTAAAATGGAAIPAAIGAAMWLTGAVMGLASHINGALPEEKRLTPVLEGEAAKAYLGTQMAFSIIGMILTMGGSAAVASAQTSAKVALEGQMAAAIHAVGGGVPTAAQMQEIVQITAQFAPQLAQIETMLGHIGQVQFVLKYFQSATGLLATAGDVSTKTTSAYFKYQTEMARADQVEQQKILSHFQNISENTTNMIRTVLRAFSDLSKNMSSYMREQSGLNIRISSNV